jgi:hypothetical protein
MNKEHLNMENWALVLLGVFAIVVLLFATFGPGREPPTEQLNQKITSNCVNIPSDDDVLFLLLEAKETEYKTRTFDQHPYTDQKGHWMKITVKAGSLLFEKLNENSHTLTSETTSLIFNMDRLKDLNDLD